MSSNRVLRPIHAFELLGQIEEESNPIKKFKLLQTHGAKPPLSYLLSLNFGNVNLLLPEGMPALDPKHMDIQSHDDFMGLLASNIHKLKYCMAGSKLTKSQMQNIFYDILINIPMKDVEILCAAKDKALEELYPSITSEFVKEAFPAYVK